MLVVSINELDESTRAVQVHSRETMDIPTDTEDLPFVLRFSSAVRAMAWTIAATGKMGKCVNLTGGPALSLASRQSQLLRIAQTLLDHKSSSQYFLYEGIIPFASLDENSLEREASNASWDARLRFPANSLVQHPYVVPPRPTSGTCTASTSHLDGLAPTEEGASLTLMAQSQQSRSKSG